MKYPGLKPEYNLKIRQEHLHIDYLDKLNDEEKDFLNRFSEEFVNANFDHGGEILHNTKKLRKDCYDRNNSRNRDLFSIKRAMSELKDLKLVEWRENITDAEDIGAIEPEVVGVSKLLKKK